MLSRLLTYNFISNCSSSIAYTLTTSILFQNNQYSWVMSKDLIGQTGGLVAAYFLGKPSNNMKRMAYINAMLQQTSFYIDVLFPKSFAVYSISSVLLNASYIGLNVFSYSVANKLG